MLKLIPKHTLESIKCYLFYFTIYTYHINQQSQINKIYYSLFFTSHINKLIIKIQNIHNYQNLFILFCVIFNSFYILYLIFNYQKLNLYSLGITVVISQIFIYYILYLYNLYLQNKVINSCIQLIKKES